MRLTGVSPLPPRECRENSDAVPRILKSLNSIEEWCVYCYDEPVSQTQSLLHVRRLTVFFIHLPYQSLPQPPPPTWPARSASRPFLLDSLVILATSPVVQKASSQPFALVRSPRHPRAPSFSVVPLPDNIPVAKEAARTGVPSVPSSSLGYRPRNFSVDQAINTVRAMERGGSTPDI